MAKNKKLIFILFLFSCSLAYGEQKYNWQKYSGKWEIKDSRLSEMNARTSPWNYYELLNNNSIISFDPFKDYSTINFNMEIFGRVETPAEATVSFNVTSEDRQWYYHMYAFKFSGGFWGINKVSLINSDRADKTKPFATKNNIFINQLASADIKLSYEKQYDFRIEFNGKIVTLFIDNKPVLSGTLPSDDHNGRIAFSTKNVKITIDKVEIRQGEKLIFKDHFCVNSIYVKVIKATRETPPKNGTEKKPE